MSPAEMLAAARELIGERERWCVGANARARGGEVCEPTSSLAERWCVYGAVARITGNEKGAYVSVVVFVERACTELYGVRDVAPVQDLQGHGAALAILDGAIALAEVEP